MLGHRRSSPISRLRPHCVQYFVGAGVQDEYLLCLCIDPAFCRQRQTHHLPTMVLGSVVARGTEHEEILDTFFSQLKQQLPPKRPLQASNQENRSPPSSKIHDIAIKTIVNYLSNREKLTEDKRKACAKALACLRATSTSTDQAFQHIRYSQQFIIRLIDTSDIYLAQKELKQLSESFCKLLRIETASNPIPYADSEYRPFVASLVVSYHFLHLQCLLLGCSKYLKSILCGTCSFIDQSQMIQVADFLLPESPFSRWIALCHEQKPQSKQKNLQNLQKIVAGFRKILTNASSMCKNLNISSRDVDDTLICLKLKSITMNTLLNAPMNEEIPELTALSSKYVPELRQTLLHHQKATILLELDAAIQRSHANTSVFEPLLLLRILNSVEPYSFDSSDCLERLQMLIERKDRSPIETFIMDITRFCKSKEQFHILDRVAVYLKESIANSGCSNRFLEASVSEMLDTFRAHKDFRRMRNLSNLLFNFGNRAKPDGIKYWTEAVSIELYTFHSRGKWSTDDQDLLCLKCSKIIENLINREKIEETAYFFQAIFQTLILDYSDNQIVELPTLDIMHLLGSVLSLRSTLAGDLFHSLNDRQKALIYVSMLHQSGALWSTQSLENIRGQLAITSKTLQLICESESAKVTTTPTNVVEVTSGDERSLLLQCHKQISVDIFQAHSLFHSYLSAKSPLPLHVEEEVIWNLVVGLQLSCLHGQAIQCITQYITARASGEVSLQWKKWVFRLHLKLCESFLACADYSALYEIIATTANMLKEISTESPLMVFPSDVLSWKLLQLELESKTNPDKAIQRHSSMIGFIASKQEFTLHDNHSSVQERLNNLHVLARAHMLSGDLKSTLNRHDLAYEAYRLGVKLLLSIQRKVINAKGTAFASFSMEIDMLISNLLVRAIRSLEFSGLSRDVVFLLNELESLTARLPSVGRKIHNYKEVLMVKALQRDTSGFETTLIPLMECFDDDRYKTQFKSCYHACLHLAKTMNGISNMKVISTTEPDLETAFLSTLTGTVANNWSETPQDREDLSLLLKTQTALQSNMKSLHEIPLYASLTTAATCLPSINGLELIFKNQVRGIRGYESIREKRISELGTLVDQLFEYSVALESLASFEVDFLRSIFTSALMTLNSISRVNASSENALQLITKYLYYFQDTLRSSAALNERQSCALKTEKADGVSITPITDAPKRRISMSTFFAKLSTSLPDDWAIVTIDVNSPDSLVLTRTTSSGIPYYLSLPLQRMATRGKRTESFDNIMTNMKEIVRQSNISTHASTTSTIKTKEDRKNWWSSRFALDLQFEEIIKCVGETWIGGFSGIFGANIDSKIINLFRQEFCKCWQDILPKRLGRLAESFASLEDEILRMFLILSESMPSRFFEDEKPNSTKDQLKDLALFCFDTLAHAGEGIPFNEIDMEKCVSVLGKQLTEFAAKHSWSRGHTVIVPGKGCELFPWECLEPLRGQSISRMTSVLALLEVLEVQEEKKRTQQKRFSYLLNPGGDLVRTQENFKSFFEGNSKWIGETGKAPRTDFYDKQVVGHDLYVYLGHGGCEEYITMSSLIGSSFTGKKVPPALLIGCSSASLTQMGYLESHGNVYNWLTAGSPMVVVNLWDVTDKDIDKFSLSVFDLWGLSGSTGQHNICEAVARSRDKCTLRHLNGSSPVVYGLPLRVSQL